MAIGLLLRRSGFEVVVVEQGSVPGGLARTIRKNGFAFDIGPHEICNADEQMIAFLQGLLGDQLLEIRRTSAQYFQRRLLSWPPKIAEIGKLTPSATLARCGWDLFVTRLRYLGRDQVCKDAEAWLESHLGASLKDYYFGPYTEKVWGVPLSDLDAKTVEERMPIAGLRSLIQSLLGLGMPRRVHKRHSPSERHFLYPYHGIGRLCDSILAEYLRLGGRIELSASVIALDVSNRRITQVHYESPYGHQAMDADWYVSTIPLPNLIRAIRPIPSDAAELAAQLTYRAMRHVQLRVRCASTAGKQWIYVPERQYAFQRITDYANFEAGMVPAGLTGIGLEISCHVGDSVWEISERDLIALSAAQLGDMGILRREHLLGGTVVGIEHAYPLQLVGTASARGCAMEMAAFDNLTLAGRQGRFQYTNMDDCLREAFGVASTFEVDTSALERPVT